MTISDWINEISVKFDELGFVPTTLTDEKNEHFVEWFVTEIEQIKESEKLLIEAAKKGGSRRDISNYCGKTLLFVLCLKNLKPKTLSFVQS